MENVRIPMRKKDRDRLSESDFIDKGMLELRLHFLLGNFVAKIMIIGNEMWGNYNNNDF